MKNNASEQNGNILMPTPPRIRLPQKFSHVRINQLIPNIVTLLSLCAGMLAMRYALEEQWLHALFAIGVSGLCDTLDGRLARLLKGTSHFGAELDSLADIVAFGVAPAWVMYFWGLHNAGPLGWVAVMVFPCCAALRLARFNTALDDPNPVPWAGKFFTGVPMPGGAGLCVFPIVVSLGIGEWGEGALSNLNWMLPLWVFLVGGLMVSRLPTFSFKKMKIHRGFAPVLLLSIVFILALLVTIPWLGMAILLVMYLASIPLASLSWRQYVRSFRKEQDASLARKGGQT